MRSVNDDHDDNGYIYDDELLYFNEIPTAKSPETPRTLTTSPEILGPIP